MADKKTNKNQIADAALEIKQASEESILDKEFRVKFGNEFGQKLSANEKQLLILLNANPSLTVQEISVRTSMTQRGVEKLMKRLKDAGIIERQGSRKSGFWKTSKAVFLPVVRQCW